MFSEASVSHFVRGGRGGGGGGLPPDRPPRIETLPWKDTQDRDPLAATEVGGTNPTGMHTC